MARLFVAIDLPPDVKLALGLLCKSMPRARWVDPANFHVTLRFIGEVDEDTADAIATALNGIEGQRFTLTLAGVGHFGRHTLWVSMEMSPTLMRLRDDIERALRQVGMPPEAQRYFPHIKLAHLRSRSGRTLRAFLNENGLFRAEPFEVMHFSLMESHLTKSGALYEHRADYALRQPAHREGRMEPGPGSSCP